MGYDEFNSLPREKRSELIRDVQRGHKEGRVLCVVAPKGMQKAHDEAKVARLQKASAVKL